MLAFGFGEALSFQFLANQARAHRAGFLAQIALAKHLVALNKAPSGGAQQAEGKNAAFVGVYSPRGVKHRLFAGQSCGPYRQ